MREKILLGASGLFLHYGFKSVTMDDIANNLGISKKTIYLHFDNKTKLVEATTIYLFNSISCGIDNICALQKNPIEEIYSIKQFITEHLENEKSSPQYQLQKYYPKIFNALKSKQFNVMQTCVIDNLTRGKKQDLYRESINIDIISRIYFSISLAIKDKDLFPEHQYSMNTLVNTYIEYHLRGICTPKGLETLNKFITSNQS